MQKRGIALLSLLVLLVTFQLVMHPISLADPSKSEPIVAAVPMAHEAVWNQTFGGTGTDWGSSVLEMNDGGFVVVGFTESFGAGNSDAWLVRTDAAGAHVWNQTFGGIDADAGYSVVEVSTGGFAICGETQSYGAGGNDVWLIRTDVTGHHLWNQTYGGLNADQGRSLIELGDGGFALIGVTASFGAGFDDVWLIRTDSAGNHQWNQTYGGANMDSASSIVAVSGGFVFGGGTTSSFGAGGEDFWLGHTDTAGNLQWNQTLGGTEDDEGYSLKVLSDGGFILAGATASFGSAEGDMWLVRTNSTGHRLWDQTFGTPTFDWGWSVEVLSDGGFAVAGATYGMGAGLFDAWLVRTDSSGNHMWDKTYGSASSDWAFSVIQVNDGGFALACTTEGFGGGAEDMWLVRIPTEGTTTPTTDFPIPGFPWEAILLSLVAFLSLALIRRRLKRSKLISNPVA